MLAFLGAIRAENMHKVHNPGIEYAGYRWRFSVGAGAYWWAGTKLCVHVPCVAAPPPARLSSTSLSSASVRTQRAAVLGAALPPVAVATKSSMVPVTTEALLACRKTSAVNSPCLWVSTGSLGSLLDIRTDCYAVIGQGGRGANARKAGTSAPELGLGKHLELIHARRACRVLAPVAEHHVFAVSPDRAALV